MALRRWFVSVTNGEGDEVVKMYDVEPADVIALVAVGMRTNDLGSIFVKWDNPPKGGE